MSNRSEGNAFEREFCEMLAERGFWAHNMAQSQAGQPADIICVKRHFAFLIDCKLMSGNYFDLNRVEPNQLTAMDLWSMRCETLPLFAVKLPDGAVRMLDYGMVQAWIADNHMRIGIPELTRHAPLFQQWVHGVDTL